MKIKGFAILLFAVLALGSPAIRQAFANEYSANEAKDAFYEPSYQAYLDANGYNGTMSGASVNINLDNFTVDGEMEATYDGQGVITSGKGNVTWSFEAAESGFYNLEIVYLPLKGTNSQIKRAVYIDGELCYSGLKQLIFNRVWLDESADITVKNNNEIRPATIELFEEQTVFVNDSQKRSNEPYIFYLEKGSHTITLESVKEPMFILGMCFKTEETVKTYSDILKEYSTENYNGENLVFQAERITGKTLEVRKSSPSITIKNNYTDPNLEPYHPYNIVYNTIGGDNWKYPSEVVEWKIDVPEEGLYNISFKGRQSANRGITSYRLLKINGEVPFEEAQELGFDYSGTMRNYILGGDEPYLFYFQKGENTISLETVLGGFGTMYTEVSESIRILNDLYRRILQITGEAPDRYIDYEIVRKVPDYIGTIEDEYERLTRTLNSLIDLTGEKGTNNSLLGKMLVQIENLIKDPEQITYEMGQFKSNINALATWMIQISEMPLELDSFTLYKPDGEPDKARAGFIQRAVNNVVRFFATFFVDNTKVDSENAVSNESVKVWIPTGRDQAQVLQNLIDERFMPEYGISVNLELIPVDVVLRSTLAGIGPDVLLSIDQTMLMDFAVRNALVDLSSLEGFEKEKARYYQSAIDGITFQGKTYGLPEEQKFLMMFYRNDIFGELDILPPKTWDELKEIIPILHMNNYDIYIPNPGPFASMIVQNGADIYSGEGDDYGITSGLSEDGAMLAFKDYTDFYTSYKLQLVMDFTNRFRTGEVPIGITEYTEYCKLELFAPEIKGLWSFAPVPGVLNPNGTIDNTVVTGTSQTVMLAAAEKKGIVDEAWSFIRWWLSTETQTMYANNIEAVLGSSARYSTADKEVLVQLPWSAQEAEQLLMQFEKTKGIPSVPGNYMTTRMIDYSVKAVVTDGANARETLYLNIKDINAELTKKRKEFGLSY